MKTNCKFLITLMMIVLCSASAMAQHKGFDPVKFRADREKFITTEAHLTAAEAAAFFPLYNEMFDKQRVIYEKIRNIRRYRPVTEEKCRAAIMEMDRLEIEINELQATYHRKFLTILKPGKLFDVIQAESRFHRKAMKEAGQRR